MTVPKDILIKSPKLHAAFEDKLPELPDIPEDIGHVLVHYLHTGTYGALKPKEPYIPSKQIVELKTSIKAYAAARAYDLPDLMRLAQEQIEKHGEGLPLPTLLEITRDSFPTLSEHDDWFIDYLKSRIRPQLEDPKSILGSDLLDRISSILSPHKILLRTVLEMFCERIVPLPKAITNGTNPETSKPNTSTPLPSSPPAAAQAKSKTVPKEESSPLKKQAIPRPSPVAKAAPAATPQAAPKPVLKHKVKELDAKAEIKPPLSTVAVEPMTAFRIEAEPVLKNDDVFKPTVMPVNRERKDSGKLLDVEPEWGLGPVIKDIQPVAEPETPERERPGKRILREVDSGFWEFSPSEPEPVSERPPSAVEILPEPVRELEPVKELPTPELEKEQAAEVKTEVDPEPKKGDDLVDKRDFAAAKGDDLADNDKTAEPEPEAPKTLDIVPVPVPVPAPIASAEPITESPPEAQELADSALDKVADKAELVGSEIMSDTAKVEPSHGDPKPEAKLTTLQPETSIPQPNNEAEVQPKLQAETKADADVLSNDDHPADSSEPKTAEPAGESKPEPAREPEAPAVESRIAPVDTTTDATPAAVDVPSSEPAPQQQELAKTSFPEPAIISEIGSAARQKSWKRKLSLRYPVLFGRGM